MRVPVPPEKLLVGQPREVGRVLKRVAQPVQSVKGLRETVPRLREATVPVGQVVLEALHGGPPKVQPA